MDQVIEVHVPGLPGGSGTAPVEDWQPNTLYSADAPRAVVKAGNGVYEAKVTHVSGSVFNDDNWSVLIDASFVDASGDAADAAALSAAAALGSQNAAATSASGASTSASNASADRVQTGLDRVAVATDRVQTGLDAAATAADRVQTGTDRTSATGSAAAALTSQNSAAASAASALASLTSFAAAATAGRYYSTVALMTADIANIPPNTGAIVTGLLGKGFYINVAGSLVYQFTLTMADLAAIFDLDTYSPNSGFLEITKDGDGRTIEALRTDLRHFFHSLGIGPINAPDMQIYTDSSFNRSGYSEVELDADGRLLRGIKIDGTKVDPLNPAAITVYSYFVGIGDSLTQGAGGVSYTQQMAALQAGRAVGNLGVGGQTSIHIARRVAQPTSIELSGNQIVSGANTVTKLGGLALADMVTYTNPYMMLSTRADNNSRSIKGTIQGIHGTLARTASGGPPSTSETYTFTPDVGYTLPVSLPSGFNFVPDKDATAAASTKCIPITWLGRNNFSIPTMQQIIDDTKACIARYASNPQRFIVMGIINDAGEPSGNGNWTAIQTINNALETLYPDNYIDIRSVLIREGLAIAGITATAQDLIDIANDVIPSSLRSDTTHLNTAGYGVVAFAVNRFIVAKGWLT